MARKSPYFASRHAKTGDNVPDELSAYQKIRQIVSRIPRGRVATYGQIARLAGLGKRARLVGYALHHTPDEHEIPWHRVINARGRISFPPGGHQYRRQRDRLAAENIIFVGDRIELDRYRWRPDVDDAPDIYFENRIGCDRAGTK